jgi:hypothetical protein
MVRLSRENLRAAFSKLRFTSYERCNLIACVYSVTRPDGSARRRPIHTKARVTIGVYKFLAGSVVRDGRHNNRHGLAVLSPRALLRPGLVLAFMGQTRLRSPSCGEMKVFLQPTRPLPAPETPCPWPGFGPTST